MCRYVNVYYEHICVAACMCVHTCAFAMCEHMCMCVSARGNIYGSACICNYMCVNAWMSVCERVYENI